MYACAVFIYVSELYVIVMKTMRISKKDLIIGGDVLTSSENLQQEGSYIGESVSEVCNFCFSHFHSSSHVASPQWSIWSWIFSSL
jgi:hypothetical protein